MLSDPGYDVKLMFDRFRTSGIVSGRVMKAYEHPDLDGIPLARVMQALSDPCRISIMRALIERRELACHELPVEVAKATLSHHVKVLREAGLILSRVEGTKRLNTVRQEAFDHYFPGLLSLIETCE
jgi:DNA-binding transcriptional ArsR family regulator